MREGREGRRGENGGGITNVPELFVHVQFLIQSPQFLQHFFQLVQTDRAKEIIVKLYSSDILLSYQGVNFELTDWRKFWRKLWAIEDSSLIPLK